MSGIPQPEWQKLAREYNDIISLNKEEQSFGLRRMAREGERIYRQHGQFQAGIVAASALSALGKFVPSEKLFQDLKKHISFTPDSPDAADFAFRYAQMLIRSGRVEEAWPLLKPFQTKFKDLPTFVLDTILFACYESEPDLMETIYLEHQATLKKQDKTPGVYISMLFYYWYSTERYAWRKLFEHAKMLAQAAGYEALDLENLDDFMQDISAGVTFQKEGQPYCHYLEELADIRSLLHTFLTYPDTQIYFTLPVEYGGHTFEAQVTREYDDSGFSAVVRYDGGVIFTEGSDLDELVDMIKDALSGALSENAA